MAVTKEDVPQPPDCATPATAPAKQHTHLLDRVVTVQVVGRQAGHGRRGSAEQGGCERRHQAGEEELAPLRGVRGEAPAFLTPAPGMLLSPPAAC